MNKKWMIGVAAAMCLAAAAGAWAGTSEEQTEDMGYAGEEVSFDAPEGMLMGGWEVTEDAAVTSQAQEAFDQAMEKLLGARYEPVALLATQVVAGTNYCFLCRSTVVAPNAVPSYKLVYVYADLKGGAEILDIQDMVIGIGSSDDQSDIAEQDEAGE
ncbi:MAG: hypothetical protein J6S83_11600 [Lachnospiraceae bacterium]|nr:hypothetical protein [Lachnospiraceae bacterium]